MFKYVYMHIYNSQNKINVIVILLRHRIKIENHY